MSSVACDVALPALKPKQKKKMSAQLASSPNYSVVAEVSETYKLPFPPFDFQAEALEDLAGLDRTGWYAEPGCGKTYMSTVAALYKTLTEPDLAKFVILPPVLINSWYRWLQKIGGIGRVVIYRGTPEERAKIDLRGADWVIMSIVIFKKDRARLEREFGGRPKLGIIDEAHSVKNVASGNHKNVRDFFKGEQLMLLTGTPISNPTDVYGYVKLISPIVYLSYQMFRNLHVVEEDFFGKVTKWGNLDLLKKNLLISSCRMLKEDVLVGLKEPVYTPIHYELEPEHRRLYQKLMDEQILKLDSGGVIDATGATRLYNAAQQIVCNFAHFSGDTGKRSAGFDVLDTVIEELGMDAGSDRKLVVFSLYKMTNRAVVSYLKAYGAVACYSEVSRTQQDKNVDRFLTDPTCKVLVAQPLSAGFGLNLQDVCSDVLFMETPVVPSHFHQAVARVYREGQKRTPNVRIALAERTSQGMLHNRLLEKDASVNKIQIGFKDLKDVIYGG